MDWKRLVEIAAPAAAGLASHGQQGAVLRGYMAEQDRIAQERQIAAEKAQQHQALGASMSLQLLNRLQQESDPVRFQQLRDVITQHADAYGIDPQTFAALPLPDGSEAKLAELTDMLGRLQKSGYDLDQLAQSGTAVQLKDGHTVPVSDALNLTRLRPIDATGAAVPPPKKADVAPSTDYARFLVRYAKDRGKKVEDLTSTDELAARNQYGLADNAPKATPDPEIAGMNKTLKELQIEAAKRRLEPQPTAADALKPYQAFTVSEKLAKAWTDSTKAVREMDRQYTLMRTGLDRFAKGDKNGGSQAVLVTFQKILDPTSVVRESEYARSSEGISLLNRIQGGYEKLAAGGAGVTYDDLAAMVETAKQFVENMKQYTKGQRTRIEAQVKKYQLDPATVFDDVLLGGGNGGVPPPVTAPPTTPALSYQDYLKRRTGGAR